MASRFFSNRTFSPFTLRHQVRAMALACPWFRLERRDKGNVSWRGPVRPTGMSQTYDVRITYRMGDTPEVSVVAPELKDRSPQEPIPHVYPGKILCLYLPGSGEWTPRSLICDTTVPWTSLWLYYYEMWHVTGTWSGGGVHPGPKTAPPKESK